MFSTEYNGYNKAEVDKYIARLRADSEKALMEEKLKLLDAEKKVYDLKETAREIAAKEASVIKMLQTFKDLQAEGNRNIEILRGEQLKSIYLRLEKFLLSLSQNYPELIVNKSYKNLVFDIESIIENSDSRKEEGLVGAGSENDSMRILLNKMREKRVQDSSPREIRIERNSDRMHNIKPVVEMQLSENDGYDTLVEKFLNTQPTEKQERTMKIQSSGFDLKEAINPKDDLSEIMKAFDFYGGNDEED